MGSISTSQADPHHDHGRHLGWSKHHHDEHGDNDREDDDDGNPSDSTHHHQNPSDSTRGDHDADDSVKTVPPGLEKGHNPFGLSDSCFAYFLTLLPSDTAALIKTDLALLDSNSVKIDSLVAQWRLAKSSHDTTISDSLKKVTADSLKDLIDSLVKQSVDLSIEIVQIGRAEITILTTVRMTCGDDTTTTTHHGISAPLIDVDVSAVTPNPVASGATTQFKISSDASTNIDVGLYDVMGILVKQLYQGQIQAGTPISIAFDVDSLHPGVYLLRVQTGTITETQRLVVK
ncbi:MAG: T9SS type A sorting domain-containing protein [Bacteroidetes bacterium]|nr:T9SS type A sorting domain-containing protein [Bacteroidota bacterium]